MKYYVGLHHHRHGVSTYIFRAPNDFNMTLEDFEDRLDEEFEPDYEDEWLELIPAEPVDVP